MSDEELLASLRHEVATCTDQAALQHASMAITTVSSLLEEAELAELTALLHAKTAEVAALIAARAAQQASEYYFISSTVEFIHVTGDFALCRISRRQP